MIKPGRKIQLLFGLVVCFIALLVLKKKNDAAASPVRVTAIIGKD
jgi:hypothetical protein